MVGNRVFERMATGPLLQNIKSPIRSITMWNRLLQKELKQDVCECRAMDCWIRRKDIKVRWVVGDVLGIEIFKHGDMDFIKYDTGNHTPAMMYVNATGLDLIITRMRERKGKELLTFANEFNKNFHEAWQAAVLITGFIDRTEKKKLLYDARTEWRKLMKAHTLEKQREILSKIEETIAPTAARETLLSWRKMKRG